MQWRKTSSRKQTNSDKSMIVNVQDTPRRIYVNIQAKPKDHEVIYDKTTQKTICTCPAESWNVPCKHKEEALRHLVRKGLITDSKIVDWAENY
jgi:hypothetical protein